MKKDKNATFCNFEVTEGQNEKINRWWKKLKKENPEIFKDKDPSLRYIFTPTGIGNGLEVLEYHTKQSIDVTDYESW